MQNILSLTELNSDDFETEKFEYTKFRNYIKDGFFTAKHKKYGDVVVFYTIDKNPIFLARYEQVKINISFDLYQKLLSKLFAKQLTKNSVFSRKQKAKTIYFNGQKIYYKFIYLVSAILSLLIIMPSLFWLWYVSNIIIRIVFMISGCRKKIEHKIGNINLPTFTILIPMYKEIDVLRQSIDSIVAIDYPSHLLDIKIVLEEDDKQMIDMIKTIDLPDFITVIIVPFSVPQNKPKALNFAFSFARGEYLGIYDAEDIPDILQLKKVVSRFANSPSKTIALQGSLCYYNKNYNFITNLCSLEYSIWFDILLPGVKKFGGFIPLGGTTNHCRTSEIESVGLWDAFNVTEDAELSCRMVKKGFEVDYLNSKTEEESVISVKAWLNQRTRWIKGYIVTLVAYFQYFNSKKVSFIDSLNFNNLCFFVVINSLLMSFLILIYVAKWLVGIETLYTDNIFVIICMACFILLTIFYIFYCFFKLNMSLWCSIRTGIVFPFYCVGQTIACLRAIYQIYNNQEYTWDKTEHGLCLNKNKI